LQLKTKETLDGNYALKKTLMAKQIDDKVIASLKTYDILNTLFRPNFNFLKKEYANPVIEYLKTIHEMISTSKILKYNIINMPLLINACCIELLDKNMNFYRMFMKDAEFSVKNKAANKPDPKYSLNAFYVAKSLKRKKEDIRSDIVLPKYIPVKYDPTEIKLPESESNDWWDNECYPENLLMFEIISEKMKLNTKTLSLVMEMSDMQNLTRLRDIYGNFLRGSFISLVGKLANRLKYDKDIVRPYNNLLLKIHQTPECHPMMDIISNSLKNFTDSIIYDSRSQDPIIASHNIIGYTSHFLKFLISILWAATIDRKVGRLADLQVDLMNAPAINVSIAIELIKLILDSLSDYLELNHFDANVLKKQVEILRELRKEEEMAKYSKDDEERNLQILLRNMGVEPEPAVDVPEYTDYIEAAGENEEADVDHEGYD
jgi:hypothetical protein